MNKFYQWPLFKKKLPSEWPIKLLYERAVWGKVPNQASDFRWIARSKGFNEENLDLGRIFNLGLEDKPEEDIFLCSDIKGRFYAIHTYPSQAADASGRRGFLEKQIIEWKPTPDIPLFLGIVAFYRALKDSSEVVWWDNYDDLDWSDPNCVLPIASKWLEPIALSEAQIEEDIDEAVKALNQEETIDELKSIYLRIKAKSFPILKFNRVKPFPLLAFAALLLPLSQKEIREIQISFAGLIPSSRVQKDFFDKWKFAALPRYLDVPEQSQIQVSSAVRKKASLMAEAIMKSDPFILSVTKKTEVKDLPLKPPVTTTNGLVVPESKDAVESFFPLKREINLKAPQKNAPEPLKLIYDFAKHVNRRILKPQQLLGLGITPEKDHDWEVYIDKWINQIEKQCPSFPDAEHWKVKVDCLKALIIFLSPNKNLNSIKFPTSGLITPLFYFIGLLNYRDKEMNAYLISQYGHEVAHEIIRLHSEYPKKILLHLGESK